MSKGICCHFLQWLKNDFLGYLEEWEKSVEQRAGFTTKEKKNLLLSQETHYGIEVTGKYFNNCVARCSNIVVPIIFLVHSFVELVKYLFIIPGVEAFLSEKLSQDPLEVFLGDNDKGEALMKTPMLWTKTKTYIKH